jgi:hypothetical protein
MSGTIDLVDGDHVATGTAETSANGANHGVSESSVFP